MTEKTARLISSVFHPVLLPSLGFLLLISTGLYDQILSSEAQKYIMLVIFFTTATLPLLTLALLSLNPKFDFTMKQSRDRILLLLFTSVFYYTAFMLLARIHFLPVFKLFMIASVVLIVVLLLITFRWNISVHMAAAGAVTATFFALSFRGGFNPEGILIIVVLVSGLTGTSRLILEKNNLQQIAAGYLLGFLFLYPVIYFL